MTTNRYAGRSTQHGMSTQLGDDWRAYAACRPGQLRDPELMWPLTHDHSETEQARDVCKRCPAAIRLECLRVGVETRDWDSVRGGMTGDERRAEYKAGTPLDEWTPPPPRTQPCRTCVNRPMALTGDRSHHKSKVGVS